MSTFKDRFGRDWSVGFTIGSVPRLRKAGLDLGARAKDPMSLAAVIGDPEGFGQVLWTLCEQEATGRNISPEEFVEGIDGNAFYAAVSAIEEALIDFFPTTPEVKQAQKAALPGATRKAAAEVISRLTDSGSTGSGGSSAGSPASTPAG